MLTDCRFSCEVALSVPFYDVDAMGVVWHGNYFRYFELAREKLLDQLNYGYQQMRDSGYLWPVVDSRITYRRPLRFADKIRVCARIEEYQNRLRIGYQIFDHSGKRATTAYTIQVATDGQTGELCFVCPPILLQRLGVTA